MAPTRTVTQNAPTATLVLRNPNNNQNNNRNTYDDTPVDRDASFYKNLFENNDGMIKLAEEAARSMKDQSLATRGSIAVSQAYTDVFKEGYINELESTLVDKNDEIEKKR